MSEERIRTIRNIIRQYKKSGEDFRDEDVITAIYKDVSSQLGPLEPKEKAINKKLSELAKDVKDIVDKKYPKDAEQIIKEAEKKAEKKFRMISPLTYVSVLYERGDKIYKVDGVFYSYGGNSIKIDEKNVAIFDLLPEYRVKFDKNYCEEKKKEFVSKENALYFQKKAVFSGEVYKKLKERQVRHNEESGYVYAWKEWRSLKDVTDIYIEMAKSGTKEPVKLVKTDVKKPKKEGKEDKPKPKEETPEDAKERLLAEQYQKLVKRAEEKAVKIGQTYAGIDADQGYGMATWSMPRKDVQLLLRDKLTGSQKDIDTIFFETGPIEKVELFYYHDYFNKVKVYFRILPVDAMRRLASRMRERYGMTDGEKEAQIKAAQKVDEEEEASGDKKKDDKKKDDKKKDDKKKEGKWKCKYGLSAKKCSRSKPCERCKRDMELAKIPQIQEYYWRGDITHGHLYVKLTPTKTDYEQFIFTKSNPKIKQEVDLMLERQKLIKEQGKDLENIDKKIDKIEF